MVPLLILFATLANVQSTYLTRDLPLHPLSPPERSSSLQWNRAKRQAYQVYLGNEVSVSVDHGTVDSGPWGEWAVERECSRTCGGGVTVERRVCADNTCAGPAIRYVSCNVEACAPDASDFRAEQCAAHNDDPLDGRYYKWVPYASKNKCELTCRPADANFYYKFADKVVDGTRCDPYGDDICVDGICLPVGCDGKLGSVAKKDKCGVCNGDGSQCKTVEGLFDERNLSPGYHDIITLPAGATAIHVEEVQSTSNVFAIKNSTGAWLLNGNYQIQVLDKNILAGGTAFRYEKGEGGTEKLTSNGPLQESITIALLLQRGASKKSAIKYEFSIPLEDVKYLWKPGEWSGCSVTCGKGIRTRALYCTDMVAQSRVEDSVCVENNATKPEYEKACKTVDCEPEWFVGEWEPCSSTCGDKGLQFRVVYCHRVFADGRRMTVSDSNCTERGFARPDLSQQCARWSCPEWQAGPWSACSSQCGDAKQFRSVTCRSAKEGEEGKLLAAEACAGQTKPNTERDCNLGPCEGLRFHTSDWELCQRCNDTEEHRNVTCQDKNGREYPLEKCLDVKKGQKQIPEDTRACATAAPCLYEWHTSQWSKCSTECGHGHKSRKVFCAINELGQTKRVDESLCGGEQPKNKEECVNEEKCTGTYFSGPWTECTTKCDGGKRTRVVVCLNYDRKPVPEWCDEKEKPTEEEECNTEPCPKCSDSEFGCCPDNVTFATGEYFAGCSNCSISEFGCCSDNITTQQGADGQGCPDWVEPPKKEGGQQAEPPQMPSPTADEGTEEGSGEEPIVEKLEVQKAQAEAELCEIQNEETGEKLQIPCTTISPPSTTASGGEEVTLESETTDGNETEKHCSKTEFGCCQDWYTPAKGPNLAECPQFVLGACNDTKFGCCPDQVTLSRGPDFEGCGDPTCAASLYGCCKDRRTIAFGPHYAGCERSSFPCELSQYGCCSDGMTAALGANGTGCGASCLLTKFGCCPDGKTQAKGANNEGCGCKYAQYGCCPDGKNSAKGPGFYGCPESCALSKFGCCPDGKTEARGPNKEGCPCQYTRWGCCDDGETTALGPLNEGCDDCRYAKYGCCQDGVSKASGPDFAGCPTTTPAPYIVDGTVSPSSIVSCSLPHDQGQVCAPGYQLVWFYDIAEGRCSQFWFGGCGGNENRFGSKEQCEQTCVEPPGIGRCYLPKVEGPQRCTQLAARYWYDYQTKQCSAFWHRGCLGNANNFDSWEQCQNFCTQADASQVHVQQSITSVQRGPLPVPQIAQVPQQQPAAAIMPVPEEIVDAPTPVIHVPEQHEKPKESAILPPPKKFEVPAFEEDDPCRLNVDSGNCQNYMDQWYFDPFAAACYRFIYSGCGGNRNRFASEPECILRCGHLAKPGFLGHKYPPPTLSPSQVQQQQRPSAPSTGKKAYMKSRESCNLRPDIGKCEGHFDSWYYEVATGQCERFTYSGCGGNANRFNTIEECQSLCLRRHDYAPPPASGVFGVSAFGSQAQEAAPVPLQLIGGDINKAHLAPICEAPKDTGTCKQFSTKWYYNKLDGTCNRFHYGGCEGNANRFETEQDCKNTCGDYRDACLLPKVIGPCVGKTERFYFDYNAKQCLPFQYSGCLGNNNNFRSVEDCRARCQPTFNYNLVEDRNNEREYENGERDGGESLSMLRLRRRTSTANAAQANHYQIDQHILPQPNNHTHIKLHQNPVEDVDGGNMADGRQEHSAPIVAVHDEIELVNDENGEAEEEEEMDIVISRDGLLYGQLPELCLLPEERGNCFGQMLRFRFDLDSGDCVGFFYTGCGQNANHFISYEACVRACGRWKSEPVCEQPADSGNGSRECGGARSGVTIPKWHFDAAQNKCAMFLWNGCGGNGNRFQSKSECENLCRREHSNHHSIQQRQRHNYPCGMPMDAGPCEDFITLWYFDVVEQQCRRFTFGGCRGNANRFVSKEDCQDQCQPETPYDDKNGTANNHQNTAGDGVGKLAPHHHPIQQQQQNVPAVVVTVLRPRIFAFPIGTLLADTSNLTLHCVVGRGMQPAQLPQQTQNNGDNNGAMDKHNQFTWYRNNRELRFASELDPQRIQFSTMKSSNGNIVGQIKILGAGVEDSGWYACAWDNSLISEPVNVEIFEEDTSICAGDKGSANICQNVLNFGLCSTLRYGHYCCWTCHHHGKSTTSTQ